MKIRELRTVLDQLRRLYGAGGAKSAEKDLKAAYTALEPHDTKSVQEFVAGAQEKLASKGRTPPQPPATADDGDYAEQYVQHLLDAGTDKAAFYAVFRQIKSDARVKLTDADVIARQYTGYKAKYKKKPAAFEDIEKVFIERARFENKMKAAR